MKTDEDIEAYLANMDLLYEKPSEGLWLVHDQENNVENIVVYHDPPIVTIRVKVMDVPKENREACFEKLLTLNTAELVHGAYGIEDDTIVLVDTLQSTNLDYNELQGSLDAIVMALNTHYEVLSEFATKSAEKLAEA